MNMKTKLLASLALAALAFCAMSAPIPSYRVATNIAEAVSHNMVTSTVTKSYIEDLGISGSGGRVNATNIINDIVRDESGATLVNISDGTNVNRIVKIENVNKQLGLSGLMSPGDKTKLDNVDGTVSAWNTFLYGSNVVFGVTNYQSGTYSKDYGKLKINELREGQYREIYDSRKEILVHITNETDRIRREINQDIGASNATFMARLNDKADKAWGKYTSAGGDKPTIEELGEDVIHMTAPHTVFGGGYEFQRVSVNEGAIWVLTDKGAPVYTAGEEGVFKFQDIGSSNYFGFAKSDSYTLGCDTDGIQVYNGIVKLTYNLTGAIPIIYYKQTLMGAGDWEPLNDATGSPISGASVLVQWDEAPPEHAQIAYIATGVRPSGFFVAQIQVAGGSKFFTNMEADFQGGITCTNTLLNVTGVIVPVYDGSSVTWQWRSR